MRALADQLGVPFRFDGTLWPRLDGGKQPLDYQISLEEMLQLDQEDPERQLEWATMAKEFEGQLVRNEYVYSCGAGIQTFHIDSTGKLSICTMARDPSFDILKNGFQEGWKQFDRIRSLTRQLETACQTCAVGALCSQCPGWSQAIHNDNETPVEFICQLGHMRYEQVQRLRQREKETITQ
jgi:radical SAM protein with 4Fe4S-binding SPASM domain